MAKRTYPHFEDCKCGKGGTRLKKEDEWHVNAKSYSNCFWVWIRHNERPHTLNEISKLLGLSISAITATEKKAMQKIRKIAKKITL